MGKKLNLFVILDTYARERAKEKKGKFSYLFVFLSDVANVKS
jgi:hypothetical protein